MGTILIGTTKGFIENSMRCNGNVISRNNFRTTKVAYFKDKLIIRRNN
jgi:hypothetical protein